MITFYPIGRLGNLMFQASAAIGYAKQFGYHWGCPRDTREVPRFLEYFPLPITEGGGRRYNEHIDAFCPVHGTHLNRCHFDFHPFQLRGDNITFFGFFQSMKYFQHCQETIKKVFALPHVAGFEDYVSIHVRRGDYVKHAGSFPPITVDYVEQAMNKINTGKFMVFSDDIAWCKGAFTHLDNSIQRFEYSEGRNEKEDLSLMASCGHHIIANSTFSWWGAYLGHNPDKVVVTPSGVRGNWFGMDGGVKKDCVDLLPEEWIKITFR